MVKRLGSFCTGCLYVWEELLKINMDTDVNTQRKLVFPNFSSYGTTKNTFFSGPGHIQG